MKKVLIITSKYGSGHETVAKTIAPDLSNRIGVEVKILDFGKILGKTMEKFGIKFNKSSENNFSLHTVVAYLTNWPIIWKYINYLYFPGWKNLRKEISDFKPDVVLSTYPMGNWAIAGLKERFKYKLVTIITDLIGVLAYWVVQGTDCYITSKPETTLNLRKFGVKKEIISELGYPLRKGFYEPSDKEKLKSQYRVKGSNFVSLCVFNTAPASFSYRLARELDSMPGLSNIVICGKNKELFELLNKKLKNTIVLGFVENISDYFHIADVTIGKAGPGFLMESFSVGCPVIITNYMIPQEIPNLKYVIKNDLGYFEPRAEQVIDRIKKLMKMVPFEREILAQKIKKTIQPTSTKHIADLIMSL